MSVKSVGSIFLLHLTVFSRGIRDLFQIDDALEQIELLKVVVGFCFESIIRDGRA